MAKFIKNIVDRIQLANRKGLCPYYSPSQIVDEVHAESMNLWLKYIKEFERTQELSVYFDPFKTKEDVALTSGVGTLVTSKGMYKTGASTSTGKKVSIVNIDKWAAAINDTVRVPDNDNPVALIEHAVITVRPTTLALVTVHFLKTPTKPVYVFTESDEDYIYDDSSSSDFEWSELLHDQIMNRVLGNLGLSQREGEMVQYSNVEQAKEGR